MSPRSSSSDRKSTTSAKADPDVYVSLLFVAVAALMVGCAFLALELNKYDWQMAQ
jgi:hypothetical protein